MNIVSQGSNWVTPAYIQTSITMELFKFDVVAFGVLQQWVHNNETMKVMAKSRASDY